MRIPCRIIAVLVLLVPPVARAQEEVKITGQVVDAADKPVSGVEVANYWHNQNGKTTTYKGATTNGEGRFTLAITFYGRNQALLALDKQRKSGALAVLNEKEAAKPIHIKLGPLVRIHGKFVCKELDKQPKWTMVYMMSGDARFAGYSSDEASFAFNLPPGKYKFWGYGTDIQNLKKEINLSIDKPDYDMGTVDMAATIIARHKGKAPPAWHVTDARGVNKDVKLADFKGKWVLLEFWGYW